MKTLLHRKITIRTRTIKAAHITGELHNDICPMCHTPLTALAQCITEQGGHDPLTAAKEVKQITDNNSGE